MGGKSKKTIIGYWYKWLAHFIFSKGPVDAVLELRAGDKTMWSGRATGNTTLSINKPNLFGGVSASGGQGGVQTDIDLMFGAADQAPNDYLGSVLGSRQTGHRRKLGIVLRGGKFGAFSSSPQTVSAKLERVLADWPNDTPWYPEKAVINIGAATWSYDDADWKYHVEDPGSTADYSAENFDDSSWNIGPGGFGSGDPGGGYGVGTYIPSGVLGKAIWIRRQIATQVGIAVDIDVYHDDGAELWWNGAPVSLTDITYYHARATIPGADVGALNVVALKVTDGVPGGSATNIYAGISIAQTNGGVNAINPAHALYLSIVHPDAQGEPVGSINDDSFRAAADRLYSESFGICTNRDPSKETPRQFQDRIGNLIGGQVNQSRVDGLYYLDLVRDLTDAEYAALPIITEDDVREFTQQPNVIADSTNCIIGKWRDPTTKADYTTRSLESPSAIRASGQRLLETKEYYELPYEQLCLRVCQRDLNMSTLPRSHINLTCLRRVAALRPCQQFRLQMPSEGIADMLLVLAKIDRGDPNNGLVQIEALTNVVGLPREVYVAPSDSPWVPPDSTAVAATAQVLMEAPYIELVALLSNADLAALPADAGYIATAAVRPVSGIGYRLTTAAGAAAYVTAPDAFDFVPSALMPSSGPADTVLTITDGVDLDSVSIGDWSLWDDEIVRVDALDATAGTIILGRGCADTVPAKHVPGSRLYFVGQDAGVDRMQYAGGEIVHAKVLTQTISDVLSEADATELSVLLDDRAIRPYPPGLLRFDDVSTTAQGYPAAMVGAITTHWAHRDRISQADQLIDESAASVGPESGTTYTVRYYQPPGTLVNTESGITATAATAYTFPADGQAQITVEAERSGYASWQAASHTFEYARITGYRVTESGNLRITESGDPRILELP